MNAARERAKGDHPVHRPLRIATNFSRLKQACAGTFDFEQSSLDQFRTWPKLFRLLLGGQRVDVIIVNIDIQTLFRLCLLRWLIPFHTVTLVSVDAIFSRPKGLRQRVFAFLKRLLLRKVDLFILYFRDLAGYAKYYGIENKRAAYVPFKSNSWEILSQPEDLTSDGDYVLAAGRTKRDLVTFLEAMRIAKLPAVLLHQGERNWRITVPRLPAERPPENVRLVVHDGDRRTWVDHIKGARVVVVPILGSTISSSGIGTYIDAMALRKAVVITEGPATRSVLDDQALMIPPSDAAAMAAAVVRIWNDSTLRADLADRAFRYANALQGEERLLRDIVQTCLDRGLV